MSTESPMSRQIFRVGPVQVTVWGNPTDRDLTAWFKGYKTKGVPAAIIRDRRKDSVDSSVSVWRHGNDYRLYPDKLKPWFEVVEECNGFTKLIGRKVEELLKKEET